MLFFLSLPEEETAAIHGTLVVNTAAPTLGKQNRMQGQSKQM